jgi:hypothetical protein
METPSERMLAAAQAGPTVTDPLGRRLVLRRLTALDKLRLLKAAGPALAPNTPWMGLALLAASVTAIDDVPVPQPSNEQQIEALVGRLGDEGLATVSEAFAAEEPSEADAVDAAGNLAGTPT